MQIFEIFAKNFRGNFSSRAERFYFFTENGAKFSVEFHNVLPTKVRNFTKIRKQLFLCFCIFSYFRGSFCFGFSGLESFYSAGGVYELLRTSVKRMAVPANFHIYFLRGGVNFKNLAASAFSLNIFVIFWMDFFFHNKLYFSRDFYFCLINPPKFYKAKLRRVKIESFFDTR